MKRAWEVLSVVALSALVMLWSHDRSAAPSREPVSWSVDAPPDLLTWPDPHSSDPPRSVLKPNLTRDPSLFDPSQTWVDKVCLGMSYGEVVQRLGPAKQLVGDPRDWLWVDFQGVRWPVRLIFFQGKVVAVEGGSDLRLAPNFLASSGSSVAALVKRLGPHDHCHVAGAGADPVYCWTSSKMVLEVGVGADCLLGFCLADPTHFPKSPHLWWTSCGALEDELAPPATPQR